jgi:predicted RNA-binding Zn-ribbon protein involved in translation (DUF1610 family)
MARGRRAAHKLKERMRHYKEQYKKKLLQRNSLRYCKECSWGFHIHERSTCPNCGAVYDRTRDVRVNFDIYESDVTKFPNGKCWWCEEEEADVKFPLNCNSGLLKTPVCISCLKHLVEESEWREDTKIVEKLELIIK